MNCQIYFQAFFLIIFAIQQIICVAILCHLVSTRSRHTQNENVLGTYNCGSCVECFDFCFLFDYVLHVFLEKVPIECWNSKCNLQVLSHLDWNTSIEDKAQRQLLPHLGNQIFCLIREWGRSDTICANEVGRTLFLIGLYQFS